MVYWTSLLAALVAGAFALVVGRRYAASHRAHQLAWSAGLLLYALASLVESYVSLAGWTVLLYRLYFPMAAGLVGLLGLGTILLLDRERWGRAAAAVLVLLLATTAIAQFTVTLTPATEVPMGDTTGKLANAGPDLGGKAIPFPEPARVAFLLLNVLGGLALIGGAVGSWWRHRRPGVLLIGLGAMLPFAGGSLSTLGFADARILLQLLGIVVMFAGYLLGERAHAAARRGATTS